jgi:hydroxyethylthiazole kinase-like uncharacterized protein yjeF
MGQPLVDTATLRTLEADAAKALPRGALMQRAGAAAARQIAHRLSTTPKEIAIVCGGGNNGGDGYVCALELARRGHRVECFALAEPTSADAQAAIAAWRSAGGKVGEGIEGGRSFDAVVDAIFGIGLSRPLDGAFAGAVDWINAQSASLRVALDVPSGLDAERGSWVGGKSGVIADLTITFIGDKAGLHTGAGCDAAGQVLVESIGVVVPSTQATLIQPQDFPQVAAPRRSDTHKGDYGNVGVLGGGAGMIGAPLLAARAALRLGAGRIYVECIGAPQMQFDPLYPELMLRALRTLERLDVIAVGCGLGTDDAARDALAWALDAQCPVVVDADGLNLLAADAGVRDSLKRRQSTTILTPHPLEAARLLNRSARDVQADRPGSARALARDTGAIVVLKGAGSIVALPDGRIWINPTGGPALATPGSGDVLGGMLAALLGQSFAPMEATLAAVWLHGAAADRHAGDVGLVAGQIAGLAVACLVDLRVGASTRP